MSARFTNTTTTLNSGATDTALAATTVVPISAVTIDTAQGLCGAIHMQAKLAAAAASQKISVYAQYSEDGNNFDDPLVASLKFIGDVMMPNDILYHYFTLPMDGLVLSAKYMRIVLYATAAATVANGTLKAVVRVPR